MKKGDIFIIVAALIIFTALFAFYKLSTNPDGERFVEIRIKNELITSVKLTDSTNMKILLLTKDNKYLEYKVLKPDESVPKNITGFDLIYIHDNGVQVLDADCPQRVVVMQGFRRAANIPLICLPRAMSITIITNENEVDGLDAIVGYQH